MSAQRSTQAPESGKRRRSKSVSTHTCSAVPSAGRCAPFCVRRFVSETFCTMRAPASQSLAAHPLSARLYDHSRRRAAASACLITAPAHVCSISALPLTVSRRARRSASRRRRARAPLRGHTELIRRARTGCNPTPTKLRPRVRAAHGHQLAAQAPSASAAPNHSARVLTVSAFGFDSRRSY